MWPPPNGPPQRTKTLPHSPFLGLQGGCRTLEATLSELLPARPYSALLRVPPISWAICGSLRRPVLLSHRHGGRPELRPHGLGPPRCLRGRTLHPRGAGRVRYPPEGGPSGLWSPVPCTRHFWLVKPALLASRPSTGTHPCTAGGWSSSGGQTDQARIIWSLPDNEDMRQQVRPCPGDACP